MFGRKISTALASAAAMSALLASTALAQVSPVPVAAQGALRPGNQFNVGDAMNISVTGAPGGGEIFQMNHPGGLAPVEFTAHITGVPNTMLDLVGFDVYETNNGTNLVEHTTLGRNQLNSDPTLMEVAYASGLPATVTFQFFNWTQAPVTLEVMPLQLPGVPMVQVGPSIPGSATAVGISSVAGVQISH